MKSRPLMLIATLLLISSGYSAHAQFSVIYNFGSKSKDPLNPTWSGIIAQGRDGNLYSTAPAGGASNLGAIFKITPAGTLTVLHSFDGTHGSSPRSGLTLGTDGNFYGTTAEGGTLGFGTVFKITPSGSFTVLYNFTNGIDGRQPFAPPIQGIDGNFYGTTSAGGSIKDCGTVYKFTPSGMFTPLFQFDFMDGCSPDAPLVQGINGNFYGTTQTGGECGGRS